LQGRRIIRQHEISALDDIKHCGTPKSYTALIEIHQQSRYQHRQGIAKMRRFGVFVISASATVSSSQLSLKFTFSPMRVFAGLIKHSLNVSVQRPQHADAFMHRGNSGLRRRRSGS
jgi:hypothetical protein